MSKFPYPKNPALTDAPLIEPIKQRWSPLAFSDEKIEQEKIKAIFEAARWTESSRNELPWRIIYATKDDKKDFDKLVSFLTEDNFAYAKDAYLLMLICAYPTFPDYNNKPNRAHQYDTGAAAHSMFLQAVGTGLVAHVVGGFDKEKPYQELGIPADVVLMTMMAVGYPGDENKVDPELLKKRYEEHRTRKPLESRFFKGKWQG